MTIEKWKARMKLAIETSEKRKGPQRMKEILAIALEYKTLNGQHKLIFEWACRGILEEYFQVFQDNAHCTPDNQKLIKTIHHLAAAQYIAGGTDNPQLEEIALKQVRTIAEIGFLKQFTPNISH